MRNLTAHDAAFGCSIHSLHPRQQQSLLTLKQVKATTISPELNFDANSIVWESFPCVSHRVMCKLAMTTALIRNRRECAARDRLIG